MPAEIPPALPPRIRKGIREVEAALRALDHRQAEARWLELSLAAPAHPEILRLLGELRIASGDFSSAIDALRRAADDADGVGVRLRLADAQMLDGHPADAMASLEAASAGARTAADWLDVGLACDRHGRPEHALHCAEQALAFGVAPPEAGLLRARCLQILGDAEAAAQAFRRLIARGQATARAWFGLTELKTSRLSADELRALERAASRSEGSSADRTLARFALGKAYEDAGRLAEARATFDTANRQVAAGERWQARRFSAKVDAVAEAFPARSPASAAGGDCDVVFIVGLPRSCTTLVEQILGSHPDVAAGGELPQLERILERESHRRGRPFPQWCADASAADWTRLGALYLARTSDLRQGRRVLTDKAPGNWLLAGAALAMLPGARILHARRDPLETIWSCYKQRFGDGRAGFTYDLDDLVEYWFDCERLGRHWARCLPSRYRFVGQDELVADPESTIGELLGFCGLSFDAACLEPHRSSRPIWTPSAAQVREPIRPDARRAAAYGDLLAPLRDRLRALQQRLDDDAQQRAAGGNA